MWYKITSLENRTVKILPKGVKIEAVKLTFSNTGFFAPFKIPTDYTLTDNGGLKVSSNKLDRAIRSIKQPKKRKVSQMAKVENSLSKMNHDAQMYLNSQFVPQTEAERTKNKRKNKRNK